MGTNQDVILLKSTPLNVGQHDFDPLAPKKDEYIGVLEVFIHQARDIHNICIYHKQDVYAKVFLTSDPESSEVTRTINGAGQNPVFDESVRMNVRNGDSSLRCEIWMLSRIKNYLNDQLLGFALVPLSEILGKNGTLEKEYELLTSELMHASCGFVKLSIVYTGSQPEVLEILTPTCCLRDQDEVSCELEKIEFPDPKLMNENEIMVSEYCSQSQSQTPENDDSPSSDSRDHLISGFPKETFEITSFKEVLVAPNLASLDKKEDEATGAADSVVQPAIGMKTDFEQKVVQQEIVDMYLKSMQQFTEALANMNLPIDKESKPCDSGGNDSTKSNGKESKGEGQCPKVFYGSRAFF
ncbi:C2 calcium-dependent membrane targeting [Artemisia annua]|uniref:C2 calcium-dependent membrane targeting n=1 Tax=Artemisia annua TaxID=35608 RepID=A0A2U1MXC8_ARTAN|nr:C2 calcium-dependent membrane targeting [Artemisia annua]